MMPHIPGRFYGPPGSASTNTTNTVGANFLVMVPFVAPQDGNYDLIGIRQTGAGTPNVRLGVYGPINTTLTNLPLILDSGQIVSAGISDIMAPISLVLPMGWYTLAILISANTVFAALPAGTFLAQLGATNLTASNSPTGMGWTAASQAYGALPSLSGTPTFVAPSSPPPALFLRKA